MHLLFPAASLFAFATARYVDPYNSDFLQQPNIAEITNLNFLPNAIDGILGVPLDIVPSILRQEQHYAPQPLYAPERAFIPWVPDAKAVNPYISYRAPQQPYNYQDFTPIAYRTPRPGSYGTAQQSEVVKGAPDTRRRDPGNIVTRLDNTLSGIVPTQSRASYNFKPQEHESLAPEINRAAAIQPTEGVKGQPHSWRMENNVSRRLPQQPGERPTVTPASLGSHRSAGNQTKPNHIKGQIYPNTFGGISPTADHVPARELQQSHDYQNYIPTHAQSSFGNTAQSNNGVTGMPVITRSNSYTPGNRQFRPWTLNSSSPREVPQQPRGQQRLESRVHAFVPIGYRGTPDNTPQSIDGGLKGVATTAYGQHWSDGTAANIPQSTQDANQKNPSSMLSNFSAKEMADTTQSFSNSSGIIRPHQWDMSRTIPTESPQQSGRQYKFSPHPTSHGISSNVSQSKDGQRNTYTSSDIRPRPSDVNPTLNREAPQQPREQPRLHGTVPPRSFEAPGYIPQLNSGIKGKSTAEQRPSNTLGAQGPLANIPQTTDFANPKYPNYITSGSQGIFVNTPQSNIGVKGMVDTAHRFSNTPDLMRPHTWDMTHNEGSQQSQTGNHGTLDNVPQPIVGVKGKSNTGGTYIPRPREMSTNSHREGSHQHIY